MAAGPAIALANGVLGKLGEIVAQQVLNEASLVIYFRQEFQWLQTKLTDISEVSEIALDAEVVIDECAVEPLYRKPTQSFVYYCSRLGFRYKMGKRIKDIKERIRSVMKKAGELNLVRQVLQSNQPSTSTAESGAELRRGSILETDSRVVAVEDRVREIVRLLDEPAVAVVAVVGMGGLLQNVYDRVKQRYEHSAWISVSQTCSLRTLQCDIARQINLQIEGGISDVLVAQLIHEYLVGKKCLIVGDFSLLEELPALEEGAMQCLESLKITNCPRVNKVPEGLEWLRRLKRIIVNEPNDELKERLEEGGDDWKKLKARNPNIQIDAG